MTAPRLDWQKHGSRVSVAVCGPTHVGRAYVEAVPRGWAWFLDMLPMDSEPMVCSEEPLLTLDEAVAAVEAQADAWPSLIPGAVRAA
jgi:hypothetical protein